MRVLLKLRPRERPFRKLREAITVCSWLIGCLIALWLIYKVPWINDWFGTDPLTIKQRVAYVTLPLGLVVYFLTKLQR
jgi:hypothetical protein